QHPHGRARVLTSDGGADDERRRGEPRGDEVQRIVETRGDLTEPLERAVAITDHRVGGVYRAIRGRSREPEGEIEAERRYERVGEILGDRLHDGGCDLVAREGRSGAADELLRQRHARGVEVSTGERRGHATRGGDESAEREPQ